MEVKRLQVTNVAQGSLAESYGIINGDVIDTYNGIPIDSSESFTNAISSNTEGVELCYIRNEKRFRLLAKPGRLGIMTVEHMVDMSAVEKAELLEKKAASIIATTSHLVEGRPVKRIIDVIGSECVYGGGPIKDMFTALRDAFGGRAQSVQNLIAEARVAALHDLKFQAASVGADAVVAINFQTSNISTTQTMIMVSVTGTAVQLSPLEK